MELEIQHNKDKKRFFTFVDGREAYLTYENDSNNVLNFNHTYVPFNLRGRNIAAKVVGHALEYVRENNLKVIPSCSYVRAFIEKNKQFSSLVEE
ncbi:MAG: GNAT family N-acetyltransferase [Ignavibacteriaceae bacterium]